MAKTDSTKILWQIQVRRGPGCKWQNKGRFETRQAARERASLMREKYFCSQLQGKMIRYEAGPGYGFGNTRVVRVEKKP